MSKLYRIIVLFVIAAFIASCGTPAIPAPTLYSWPEPQISRHPELADYSHLYPQLTSIPKFSPDSAEPWQIDLRSQDLTKIDMTGSLADLLYANFDSKTKWPVANMMPAGFDPQEIIEMGKDPGLGIRILHKQDIIGKGIGIAIIDQPLLVDHQEYKDRLQLYEEINILPDAAAQMHGAAVASIAVGKTVGVAPEADLYYIGAWTVDWAPDMKSYTWNFTYYAQAVRRILEINQGLPKDRKIRVIAMQVGWSPDQAGYDDITAAVNEAKAAGIFVISSSLGRAYKLYFQGLGRGSLNDPNKFESYTPGLWWEKDFYAGITDRGWVPPKWAPLLLVPMDSRTTAAPTGTNDYAFYREGGWSWSIPYLAGTYVLAVQVKPDITPEEFWSTALETGQTIQLQHDGKNYEFGVILDPQSLIDAIKTK